jgi:predicted glycosyltransferase
MEQMEKLRVLLPHWIQHNRGHAEEYGKWSALARQAGETEVADHIESAIAAMNQASELLDKALLVAGGEMPDDDGHHHHHHH